MAIKISDKAQAVLEAIIIGKCHTREEIATHLKSTIPSVNGALTGLLRNGLVEVNVSTGSINATPDASMFVKAAAHAAAPRSGTKMELATKIFEEHFNEGRKSVISLFQKSVGLTEKGAATYYQTLRERHGMVHGIAAQSKAAEGKAK